MTSINGNISALLAICAGNSPVTGEFPAQRPVTRSFDVFFYLDLNKRLNKQCEAGDLTRHRAHYDVTVMVQENSYVANYSTCSRDNTPNTWSQHDCRYQQYEVDRSQNFTVNITRWCGENTTTYINVGLHPSQYGYLNPYNMAQSIQNIYWLCSHS